MIVWLFIAGTCIMLIGGIAVFRSWCKAKEKEWRRRNRAIDAWARESEKPTVLPSLEDVEEEGHEMKGLPSSAVMDDEDEEND